MSVYMVMFAGSIPIGNLAVGWLSSMYGASTALLICAILSMIFAGAGWVWRKPAEQSLAKSMRF